MVKQTTSVPFSQRQLRVGELVKQSLGQIFLRDEAKVPILNTKNITVTEVAKFEYLTYLFLADQISNRTEYYRN